MALAGNKADMVEARQVPAEVCNFASQIPFFVIICQSTSAFLHETIMSM
jgi:hypothetical protein